MDPLLIAHRGDTVNFQENTKEAFRSAFELGAEGIELDIQFHKGKLIVVHDYLFDRTKNYPLLEDVLREFISKGRIEIEIKSFTFEFLPHLVSVLSRYRNPDIELTTSVLYVLPELRKQLPQISLGVIFQPYEFEPWMTKTFVCRKICEVVQTLQANVAHVKPEILNKELIEALHERQIKVHSHIRPSDRHQQIELFTQFRKLGVDQCTFDDIRLLASVETTLQETPASNPPG